MNRKIPFHELASLLAANCNISPEEAEDFIKNFFDQIAGSLGEGESVKIKGIGTFGLTGEKDTPVSFTPDAEIADTINAPFALFEPEVLSDTLSDEALADIDAPVNVTESIEDEPSASETSTDDNSPIPTIPSEEAAKNEPATETVPAEEKNEDNRTDENDSVVAEAETPCPVKTIEETTQVIETTEEAIEAEAQPAAEPELVQPTAKAPIKEPPTAVATDKAPDTTVTKLAEKPVVSTITPTPSFPEEEPEEYLPEAHGQKSGPGFGWGFLTGIIVGLALGACAVYFAIDYIIPTPAPQESVIEDAASDEEVAQVLAEAEAVLRGDTAISAQEPVAESKAIETGNEAPKTEEPVEQPKSEPVKDTVRAGYLLHDMAKKHYGNKCFWVYIYEENKAKITNPNRVSPGLVLIIPQAEKYGINASSQASIKTANEKAGKILAKFPR
ncbi:MAG: HU family DNA-binding protein [Paenibacillus sp.]|nr:HU family DNA-binding protein [Paenibacillus sp.]